MDVLQLFSFLVPKRVDLRSLLVHTVIPTTVLIQFMKKHCKVVN